MRKIFNGARCVGTNYSEVDNNVDAKKITYIDGCCPLMDFKMGRLMPDAW